MANGDKIRAKPRTASLEESRAKDGRPSLDGDEIQVGLKPPLAQRQPMATLPGFPIQRPHNKLPSVVPEDDEEETRTAVAGRRPAAMAEIAQLERQNLELRERLQERERELLELRESDTTRERQVLEARDAALAAERVATDLQARVAILEGELETVRIESEAVSSQRQVAAQRAADFKAGAKKIANQLNQRSRELREARTELQRMEADHRRLQAEVERLTEENRRLAARVEEQAEVERLIEDNRQLAESLEQHAEELDELRSQYADELAELTQRHRQQAAELEHQRDALASEIEVLRLRSKSGSAALERARAALDEAIAELAAEPND